MPRRDLGSRFAPLAAEAGPARVGLHPDLVPVSAIMTTEVVAVQPDMDLHELAALLLRRGISGAPVVDAEGRAIGMVSKTDVLERLEAEPDTAEQARPSTQTDEGYRVDLGAEFHVEETSAARVLDVMMPLSFAVHPDAPISRASALMAAEGVHRLPVLGDSGKVVGVLSPLDVLRWIARESGLG